MDRCTALAGGTAVHRFSAGYSGGAVAAALDIMDDRERLAATLWSGRR